ncbi:hypothetical protein JGS22_012320 [Streptomyces sp. P38-E01]|uniref:Uncharacterized protein n=1 Tax=Streptomyces tardus TaxID=2780544 RepID=A0A949JGW7_9ACTN|nr:hypothetical protein [Streptomyces tardus]MBU7598380.1 hypothetical protein [Streptomyces tardus]
MSKRTGSNSRRAAKAHASATGTGYQKVLDWQRQGFPLIIPAVEDAPGVAPSRSVRAAEVCATATGWKRERCEEWAAQGFLTTDRPVPDGYDAEQRSLEAHAANVLGNELSDGQLDGKVLGITRLRPAPNCPTLVLQPQMANAVLAALLPRHESAFGGLKGIPGLRIARLGRNSVILERVGTRTRRARLELRSQHTGWQPRLPTDRRTEEGEEIRQLWNSDGSLLPVEEESLDLWNNWPGSRTQIRVDRDWVLSRMLRRSCLLNKVASAHGWANTYTHGYDDLVLEWCCGIDLVELRELLAQSGLLRLPPALTAETLFTPEFTALDDLDTLLIGSGLASLRRRRRRCLITREVAHQVQETLRREFAK